ncbi:DUF2235 domain-containing protein [Burkholderia glumae]|uniref:DUF2235 domain-containing protein n=1 Tax=Burkholderia glumae TaxID=337 RepID=A0AAP9Y068_BURGL|nr:DUF2235 domain-containing protein [Burkholderia glumae]ACR30689.1 Hypothetical protein bglu_2g02170 [Burkholderia glumae BGR1]AJY63828.1 hypothetical protein KS03_3430 [Burkholderia glumae LMG 2196 = ATCC 33617]KHJ62584.1 hypothetical protein NCPPB3923_12700 [Burkholderia glumae]MCM2484011.1 DUF2235 domain-containing protein [Burkholderia glumae]MCM2509703.1 DUF2235 domain-containing protein [Burkholderia glumae]
MADTTQLDPADRTSIDVQTAIGEKRRAYPTDACIPCGAVIHIGFFFDGFGRHRDHDDPATSRYSNICRLWEAHRDNKDRRREKTPNQFWYRFYYSGLGTDLNKEAREGLVTSAVMKAGKEAATAAEKKAVDIGKKVAGVDRLAVKPQSALSDGVKKGLEDFSYRPVVKSFNDLVGKMTSVPKNVGRVLTLAHDDRWVRRARAAARAILYDAKKNPMKVGWDTAKEVFIGVALDFIPWCRDNRAVARLLGTGVEVRVAAAKTQFEKAIEDTKLKMPKIQRIQVSIFGADRGAVLARALANELTEKYKHPSADKLAYVDPKDPNQRVVPIEIKFLGLLDAVSSLMEENKVLSMVPALNMIKQNYGDQKLAVPESVERCVHFAAAHELRFYQRLDSLEKTRGLQYLYPGTSEDITGGAPAGTLGARAELQRVVLRDMLHEAITHGIVLDLMEDMFKYKPDTFAKFTLAHPLSDGKTTYKIGELIEAYQEIVPKVARLNFLEHMQVFLRWMAVRYQSPAFRSTVTSRFDTLDAQHRALLKENQDAESAYIALRNQNPPADSATLAKALARWQDSILPEMVSGRDAGIEKRRPSEGIWERIQRESQDMMSRESQQAGLRRSVKIMQDMAQSGDLPWDADPDFSVGVIQAMMMSPEQEALAQAWKMGLNGSNPLPPKVMALFDLLVHDTMLTSWHDHLLSSTLYFQTRATDTFGVSDYAKEEKQRKRDEKAAERIRQVSDAMTPPPPDIGSSLSASQ